MIREHVEVGVTYIISPSTLSVLQHLMTTGGSSCIIPRVLSDVLATQACHGM